MAARIGIDTGGTFTDVVRWSATGLQVHKLRSTPDDPSRAVLAGLAAVRRSAAEPVDLVHGTTVGLNAVLTGAVARTVFVTNRGFEDLIEIGRQDRAELYALQPDRPQPPVPRALRVGVACRRAASGAVLEPLRADAIERTVAAVRRRRPQAVAIGLLHAPVAPADEQRLASALRRALPGVPISCSAELVPTVGEYERFCAVILNAAIAPLVGRYTQRIAAGLGAGGLRLLRSSQGILPPDEAIRFPAKAMFSGPAGGVLAARQVAVRNGCPQVAAFDMGGTSADFCLVERHTAPSTAGAIAGLPLPLPSVPVHTVGCGGGSIAYADAGGALRVGPESAGADPGPACYGVGRDATVTDAHVALGHLGADSLLGGAFPIDVGAAVRAIERLARRLGMSALATARGIVQIAEATMARAVLGITAEQAVDPGRVPLLAYGGAGGLHAAALAARLGMPKALMPIHPGAFSALGLALAGETVERTVPIGAIVPPGELPALLRRGRQWLGELAAALPGRPHGRIDALVRYRGQGGGLLLPLSAALVPAFTREHRRRYGFVADNPLEIVQLELRAELPPRRLPLRLPEPAGHTAGSRRAPLGRLLIRVIPRSDSPDRILGPAVVEEPTGAMLIPAGWHAVRASGCHVLSPPR